MVQKNNIEESKPFRFKQFSIEQDRCAMKIGTDSVLLGAWIDTENAEMILDIGTGTGVIALMLAQRNGNALIHGVDVDESAVEQAKENMQKTEWTNRLDAFALSIQQYAQITDRKYDLIASNPPFFTGGTLSHNQDKTNVRHTVKLPHGELLNATRKLLNEQGKFCVILPLIEGLRFKELAETYRFHCTKMTEIKPKADKPIERLLLQFELKFKALEKDTLIIMDENGEYSDTYKDLTKDFYLNF